MKRMVRIGLGLVAFIALGVGGRAVYFATEMESLQKFALEILKEEHPGWALRLVGNNGIEIRAHGHVGNIYVDNVLREANSDRPLARSMIEQIAASLERSLEGARGGALPPLAEVEARLRPMLVPRKYAEDFKLAVHPLVEGVVEVLAIDSPEDVRYVSVEDLKTWQVEFEAERRHAEAALWQASRSLQLEAKPPGDPKLTGKFIAIAIGDAYDAARFALPEIRAELGKQLGYPFFAAVPNQDFCIAWSQDYAFAEQVAAKVQADFESQSHPISPHVFRVDADRIAVAQ